MRNNISTDVNEYIFNFSVSRNFPFQKFVKQLVETTTLHDRENQVKYANDTVSQNYLENFIKMSNIKYLHDEFKEFNDRTRSEYYG